MFSTATSGCSAKHVVVPFHHHAHVDPGGGVPLGVAFPVVHDTVVGRDGGTWWEAGRRRRLFQQQLRYSLAHLLHHITSSNDSSQIESELGKHWLVQSLKFTLRLSHQYSFGVSFLRLLKLAV